MKLRFRATKILTCTHCQSMRLDMIGDVIICVDCNAVRALS